MTVYELIQELAKYDATSEVKFHADFEYSVDVEAEFDRENENDTQEVTVDVEIDEDLGLDEVNHNFHNEVILKLVY